MRNGSSIILLILLTVVTFMAGCTSSTGGPLTTPPSITSVSIIPADPSQTIYIEGSGFGDTPPQTIFLGDGSVDTLGGSTTPSLSISDNGGGSHTWEAGRQTSTNTAADAIGLIIVKWSNNEIVLGGFGKSLGTLEMGTWNIGSGDPLVVNIWTQGGQTSYKIQTSELLSLTTPQPTLTSSELSQVTLEAIPETTEANKIAQAINWQNPTVKNFANTQVQHSSAGNYNVAQICDVWQSIYNQWTYVSDPPLFNYFTSASDSINNGLKGNCVDYAILNAAVIKSIGGDSRVITACPPNGGECHAYAEVALAKTQSDLQADANYVCSRYHCEKIYYHIESDNQGNTEYWLNLDWQANYPGGKFFDDDGTFQVFYPNGLHVTEKDTGYSNLEPNVVVPTPTAPLLYSPTT